MQSQVGLRKHTTNKASGGDGVPVELFQILKDDVVKVLHSICQQILQIQEYAQDWKRSVFIPIPKKGNAKEGSNYGTTVFISYASKVLLKILQPRLQQSVNWEIPDGQAGLEKAEETEIKWPTSVGLSKRQGNSRKTTSALLTTPEPLTVWITTNFKNSERDGNTRPPDLLLEKSVCRSGSNS